MEAFKSAVPVWSGASHATLSKLARLIGAPLIITPSETAFFNGESYGSRHGDADFTLSGGEFSFSFATDLPHLVYNESTNANQNPDPGLRGKLLEPGPYRFQEATTGAVRVILRQFVAPSIVDHISTRQVR